MANPETPVTSPWRKLSTWLGLAFTAASLIILLAVVNLPDLFDKLRHTDGRFLLLAIVFVVLASFLRAIRWQTTLRSGIQFWPVFHAENIGYLINNLLPLRVGEPARAVVLSRSTQVPAVEALSTVVLARVSDLIAVLVILGLVLPALPVTESVRVAGYGTLVLALALIGCVVLGTFAKGWLLRVLAACLGLLNRFIPSRLTPLSGRVLSFAEDFLNGLQPLRQGRRLAALIVADAALWLVYFLQYQTILLAFSPGAPLAWAALATCTASLSTAIPSSPAYVGVYHAVLAFTLTPYIGQDAALGCAIVLHALEFIVVLLFGLFSLLVSGNSLGKVSLNAHALTQAALPDHPA